MAENKCKCGDSKHTNRKYCSYECDKRIILKDTRCVMFTCSMPDAKINAGMCKHHLFKWESRKRDLGWQGFLNICY